MVLPSDVVGQEEVEEKTEGAKEEKVDKEEGKVKEGAEEGPDAEELGQAVVVVPTPPETGTVGLFLRCRCMCSSHQHFVSPNIRQLVHTSP